MKKSAFLFILLSYSIFAFAQDTAYWQQALKYKIDVTLNTKENTIRGTESIVYKNNSPQTLEFIWFHIWPNAYKSENTALFKQLKADTSRSEKLGKYTPGSIEGLAFKVNGKGAVTEPHSNPDYIDVIKVKLPQALKPGESCTITTPFTVKLPSYFSRSGFADGQFMLCQWYPKPAVFDRDGWHEFPYLDMGEFYSEFADFDVNITVPSNYVVAASGTLNTKEEADQYKAVGSRNAKNRSGKPELYQVKSKGATKTLNYTLTHVPDFAWFADKDLVIQYDTAQVAGGKVIDAFTYYHNKPNTLWVNSIDYTNDAVKKYSAWVGTYAYPVVQVVEGPKNNASGGMEYPTITLITSPDAKVESLDAVIAHEVGHNWFMSMLGSNERKHAWQDEGLNTYFQFRYEAEKYKGNSVFGDKIPANIKALPTKDFQATIYNALSNVPMPDAIDKSAEKFSTSDAYSMSSYLKPALWVYILESQVGREKIDKAFQSYFNKWNGKHPQPGDLQKSFEESLGMKLDQYFSLLNKEGDFR
ncbi:M1 family metallopeptidase [Pedobacter sp. SYP-B3415]|uniref:M1 family metallopeptidase n=1 Tax=Pedobacter sp. SYP-B3415 TaxID=2496641 RepID=UPI00101C3ABE|nr:M1 family metallopeptidase [Pedobacter sp. SYP-B3415]